MHIYRFGNKPEKENPLKGDENTFYFVLILEGKKIKFDFKWYNESWEFDSVFCQSRETPLDKKEFETFAYDTFYSSKVTLLREL